MKTRVFYRQSSTIQYSVEYMNLKNFRLLGEIEAYFEGNLYFLLTLKFPSVTYVYLETTYNEEYCEKNIF